MVFVAARGTSVAASYRRMQKPLELTFRHLDPGHLAQLEPMLQRRVDRLERLVSDIIGCRVVVERPQRGHHSHNPYRVRIRVTVAPSTRLVVTHQPLDPASSAHEVAQQAFDAMERQLAEFIERRRDEVKLHTRVSPVYRS
jgi:hypothetical protein